MDWLSAFSDDQVALIGCVFALGTAFAVMSLTWTVRQSLQPKDASVSAFAARQSTASAETQEPARQRRAA
ncbi:MAG: hypothetical protein KDA75_01465 [Planctomycetaceae bacterium]|nr:hypothetical protein [Planctomycetaceae bacterium]